MSKKIFLVEDWDCNYKAFEDIKGAMRYAIETINSSSNTEENKNEMLMELITSFVDRETAKWDDGFTIDDFLWCWAIDLVETIDCQKDKQ